ncbi:MAG: FAD-dependent oxidoreductase [Actinomycetota bacterium]|nr:FAD-dependent oxidoreductase [Actinomycetota bacterium]
MENRAFKGSDPRGDPAPLVDAARETVDGYWRNATNFDRRAEVTSTEQLTTTGTVVIDLRVLDERRFVFSPGQFIGIKTDKAGSRRQRAPYCILSPPGDDNTFRLLVRVVPDGPRSQYLTALRVADIVDFRGPTGRSMVPKEEDTDLVLLATGVGVSPLYSLACHMLTSGSDRKMMLLWGLRTEADICLLDQLDDLAARSSNFSYQISLSAPSVAWPGLRGRVSETARVLMGPLAEKHFYLDRSGRVRSGREAHLQRSLLRRPPPPESNLGGRDPGPLRRGRRRVARCEQRRDAVRPRTPPRRARRHPEDNDVPHR